MVEKGTNHSTAKAGAGKTGSQGKGGSGKVGTELQHGPFISVLFWGVGGGGDETGSAEDG